MIKHNTKEVSQQITEIARMPAEAARVHVDKLVNRIGVELFCVLLRRDAVATLKLHSVLVESRNLVYGIQYAAAYAQAVYEHDGALNALANTTWSAQQCMRYEVIFAFVYDYMYCFIRTPGISKQYILLIDNTTPGGAVYAQSQVRAWMV